MHFSLLLSLAGKPLWLGGIAAMVCGQLLGVAVFHERLRDSPLALLGQSAALVAVVVGMVLVSRSKALGARHRFHRSQPYAHGCEGEDTP
jgi:hypothetical protein